MTHIAMTRTGRWLMVALMVAHGAVLPAAELPDVTVIPAAVAGERGWDFADQGEFTGTLVGIVGGKARIRMSDGVVREFEPGWSKGASAAALRRAMCRMPEQLRRSSSSSPGSSLMVRSRVGPTGAVWAVRSSP
jgi:hypothetical protein